MKNFKFMDINTIISYLTSSEIQTKLFTVKIVFLAVSLLFVIGIIFSLTRSHYLQWLFFKDFVEFFTFRPYGAKKITKAWNRILRRLETTLESDHKLAVIEADDMLDNTLKRMGYAGQNLEERLKRLTAATLPNIAEIYEAHKTRNNIVRDPNYRLSSDEAKKILDVYEKAFKALQMMA